MIKFFMYGDEQERLKKMFNTNNTCLDGTARLTALWLLQRKTVSIIGTDANTTTT